MTIIFLILFGVNETEKILTKTAKVILKLTIILLIITIIGDIIYPIPDEKLFKIFQNL